MIYDTINLFPVGTVSESWEWKTDILTSLNGSQSRMCLREFPRISLSAKFFLENGTDNTDFYDFIMTYMKTVHYCPQWHKAVQATTSSPLGSFKVFFQTASTSYVSGDVICLLNMSAKTSKNYIIDTVDSDGINLTVGLLEDVNQRFLVMPTLPSYLDTNANIRLGYVTSNTSLTINSIEEPPFLYPGDPYSLVIIEGMPVMTEVFEGDSDGFDFGYEILDNEVGKREFRTSWTSVFIKGKRTFNVNKMQGTQMSFWRTFCNAVRGAWKPFLMSTQRTDKFKTLGPEFLAVANGSQIVVDNFVSYEEVAYSFIKLDYDDNTSSYHRVTTNAPYILITKPDFKVIDATPRYFDLHDYPGATVDKIAAGGVKIRVAFGVTLIETNGVNQGGGGAGTLYVRLHYMDDNFEKVLTTGWFDTQVESGGSGTMIITNELLAPAGAKYISYETEVITALFFVSITYDYNTIEIAVDGVYEEITNLYTHRLLNITPNLPNDAKVQSIPNISNLLKCHMDDKVEITHTAMEAVVDISYRATNEG